MQVKAYYDNHADWPSPIEVVDDPTWTTTYPSPVSGTATNSNNDGTLAGSVTIYRAGDYELTITVDGSNVINSPHLYLQVEPEALYAPYCEPVDIPTFMYAGYDYWFLIQGRDLYKNNL